MHECSFIVIQQNYYYKTEIKTQISAIESTDKHVNFEHKSAHQSTNMTNII